MSVFWSDLGVRNPQATGVVAPSVNGNGTICVLDGAGAVQCLGRDAALGDGTTTSRSTLGPVPIGNVTALAGGDGFCAVSGGAVSCWGAGSPYQPAYGQRIPMALAGPSGVTALAMAGDHGCGLAAGGQLWCWGSNEHGQLGDGTCSMNVKAVVQSGSITATAVGLAEMATCTVGAGGVACFGYPVPPSTSSSCPAAPVAFPAAAGAQHLVGGENFFCSLDAQGAVACWGDNSRGQLGAGSDVTTSATPVPVAGFGAAKLLAAGGGQACVVNTEDKVFCWGWGNGVARPVTPISFE
jgi:alpha-tubulin suppressor-like RCC1 family protein